MNPAVWTRRGRRGPGGSSVLAGPTGTLEAIEGVLPLGLEPLEELVILGWRLALAPPRALTRRLVTKPRLLFLSLDGEELIWLIGHGW
jgi:hypothetical protein